MEEKKNNATEKVENIVSANGENAATEREEYYRSQEERREAEALRRLREKEAREQMKGEKMSENKTRAENLREGAGGSSGGNTSDKKHNKAPTGWVVATVILASITLIVTTLFVVSMTMGIGNNKQLTGTVDEAYYDLVNYVSSMDVDMSKLLVSNDKKRQQKLLVELTSKARLAADDITRLPIKDESKFYTTKFVNQVGDFSKYLNNKLIDGLSVTEEDKNNLKNLYDINGSLKDKLSGLTQSLGADYDFITLLDADGDDAIISNFNDMESNAVDYPKLIYDGPFSDSLDEQTPKGLNGDRISLAEAERIVKDRAEAYGISDIEASGEGNGVIKTYGFDCDTEDEGKMHVEVAQTGGKIVMFECYRDCTEEKISLEQAEKIADKFLESLGYNNMKAVWATEKGAVAYFNYVGTEEGVAVYPDMIKLTVCKERAVVSTMDAREYVLNHKQRTLEKNIISAPEAKNKVGEKIEQETCRLVIVPYGETKEVLAYEISGKADGVTYYVYIDAVDGKEIEIFRVVETTEGTLLI